jgi:hypothetical protein
MIQAIYRRLRLWRAARLQEEAEERAISELADSLMKENGWSMQKAYAVSAFRHGRWDVP